MDKYAGEMKRGGTRKDVRYRCKQGGEKMTDEMVRREFLKIIVRW